MNILDVQPTKNSGQRALDVSDAYMARIVPSWYTPPVFDANAWRRVVAAQEIAVICKETLIASILALEWKIAAKDSSMQDELAGTIKYYTNLLTNWSGLEYTDHVEFIASDLLDTPFGGMSELGRDGDNPTGRVRWVEPIDAATLYPTLNKDFPVIQYFNGSQVAFPKHAVARVGMTPRTKIEQKGWYVCPPEKIYMAMQMLSRGDTYYANLLLDIPTAGILDLGDMEKESALAWVDAYKGLLANGGNSSFKIPVLYEHNNDIKYVPFGKVPNDIMFDRITLRYAAITCSGYGMTLSDIGIQTTSSGGETLAGSIRSERKTRKNGFARLKSKLRAYFQQILPPTLEFSWIDFDDEVNAALGRSRLANASAFKLLREMGIISISETRQQLMADGMFTISMPEEPPADVIPSSTKGPSTAQQKPNILGNPAVPASLGGHGSVKKSCVVKPTDLQLRASVAKILDCIYDDLISARQETGVDDLPIVRNTLSQAISNGDISLHGVDLGLEFSEVVSEELSDFCSDILKKSIAINIKTMLLADDAIDFGVDGGYDSLLDTVSTDLGNQFEDVVAVAVNSYQGE